MTAKLMLFWKNRKNLCFRFSVFTADEYQVLPCVICGAEQVSVATVFELQPLPQLLGCHREVTGSDVGLCDASKGLFQLLLVH